MKKRKIGVSNNPEKSRSYLENVFHEVRDWMVLGGPYTHHKADAVCKRLLRESKFKEQENLDISPDESDDWFVYYFEHDGEGRKTD